MDGGNSETDEGVKEDLEEGREDGGAEERDRGAEDG